MKQVGEPSTAEGVGTPEKRAEQVSRERAG